MERHLDHHRPTWTLTQRLEWLKRFRCLVAIEADNLAGLIERETGKPPYEALTADLMPTLAAARWHERHARTILRPRRLGGRAIWQFGQRHTQLREPLGTVAIIATWNYPVQLLGIQLIQALVAGNRVIVKPSENAPRTQVRLLELATQAGLPPNILTWVEPTREAGARLLRESAVDHVVFTGSTSVGRAIAEWAAETLTPSTLELSGRDSAFVLDDAHPALAARTIWHAVTMNAGQTCMAPRRTLVHRDVYPAFVRELMPLAAAARPVCLISEAAALATFNLAAQAITDGGRSASGVIEQPHARTLRPLAILDCDPATPLVDGDHFGPALAVVPVDSLEEAMAIHARCDQHLATSIFTRNPARARALAARLRAGHITINDCVLPTAHPGAALAGTGRSGWGVTRGKEGLLAMTRTVTISTTSPLIRPPTAMPSAKLVARMSALIRSLYAGGRRAALAPAPIASAEPSAPVRARTHAPSSLSS